MDRERTCVNLSFPFLRNGQYGTKDDSRPRMMNSSKDTPLMIKTLCFFGQLPANVASSLPVRDANGKNPPCICIAPYSLDHLLENIPF